MIAVASVATLSGAAQPADRSADLAALLTRVGERVRQYYDHAQTVVCLETTSLQPLGPDFLPDGHARRLAAELRVVWDPVGTADIPPEANVLRKILKIDGRAPAPSDAPGCMDPRPISPEPLAMFLAERRREYAFTVGGLSNQGGRRVMTADYKALATGPAAIVWRGECVTVSLPGRARGRVWIDVETADVLRLDERLMGSFEFNVPPQHARGRGSLSMVIERADSSIRYKPVVFREPDETLLLPSSIDTVTIIRGSGVPRLRTTQNFTGYKRFLTDARVVSKPGGR